MAPVEVLFNATIVLIPIWLGVARYIIKETEFQSKDAANVLGLGMVAVLFGILYSMWISVQALASQSEGIAIGFYGLFVTIGLTGFGGVLFIIREIEHISGQVVMGIPVGVVTIGLGVILLPPIVSRLLPQIAGIIPDSSIDSFFSSLLTISNAAFVTSGIFVIWKRFRIEYYEYRAKQEMDE